MGHPDHLYLYRGGMDSLEWAATRQQQWPPKRIGRYRNCDPVLKNSLVWLGGDGRREGFRTFSLRELFDEIGISAMVMKTAPYGNSLIQGYEFVTGRDWARLGNLYL